MDKLIVLLLLCMISVAGCRNSKRDELPEVKLKEFVGHTPIQVLAGMTLGIINAVLMYHFVF
jgi:acid phosphatase family membrane protein YuiD